MMTDWMSFPAEAAGPEGCRRTRRGWHWRGSGCLFLLRSRRSFRRRFRRLGRYSCEQHQDDDGDDDDAGGGVELLDDAAAVVVADGTDGDTVSLTTPKHYH